MCLSCCMCLGGCVCVCLCVSVCVATVRNLWRFLKHVTKDVHQLTEYVSKNQDKATLLLKKPPDKL